MEPEIRRFDLVAYANIEYGVGDVVVFCPAHSYCFAHRVIGVAEFNTSNGIETRLITKGDNSWVTDSPVDPKWVRGKVVLVIPREAWVPLVATSLAYAFYGLSRIPVVGVSYALVFVVGLSSVMSMYTIAPHPPVVSGVEMHTLNLVGVYFDSISCTITVRYDGKLALTDIKAMVNSEPAVIVRLDAREVVIRPSHLALSRSFMNGEPVRVEVQATLNHRGRLAGEYTLVLGGAGPEVYVSDGRLILRNPNCFPIRVNVSVRYYSDEWKWYNQTLVIDGFSFAAVTPPEGSAYAYVEWLHQGDRKWAGVPLR